MTFSFDRIFGLIERINPDIPQKTNTSVGKYNRLPLFPPWWEISIRTMRVDIVDTVDNTLPLGILNHSNSVFFGIFFGEFVIASMACILDDYKVCVYFCSFIVLRCFFCRLATQELGNKCVAMSDNHF